MTQAIIEVENLSVGFGEGKDRVPAVKQVSFTVTEGDLLA